MHKHLLICNIFFIFLIHGKTIPPYNTVTKTSLPVVPQSKKNDNTTQYVISEGGSVIPSSPVTLSNGNYLTLINLEKEISANKEKPVVPRKGVDNQDVKSHDEVLANSNSSAKLANETNKSVAMQINTTLNGTNLPNHAQKINDTKIHKPLIVSSEALAKMDEINNVDIAESRSIKFHSIKADSHPGMIMPIVITILVVPVFAVVGYMALKRGKEAWKNRHYKRMDFLLDGMYND